MTRDSKSRMRSSFILLCALIILSTQSLMASGGFVAGSSKLYFHRSVGKEGYLTDILTAAGRGERPGFILSSYTDTKSIFQYYSKPLRWTFNGKTSEKTCCYSGGLPQVAVSPKGRTFACIDGVVGSRLLLVRETGPDASLQVIDVTSVDAQQIARSVAFFGIDSIVFLRYAGNKCDTFDAQAENTIAVSRDLRTGREQALGCAISLVERGSKVPALVRKTASDVRDYSLDGGATWRDGDLATVCGTILLFWMPHSNRLMSSTGQTYDTPVGTNVVTCEIPRP